MVLDKRDPTIVDSLVVLVEGDDSPGQARSARSTSRTTSNHRNGSLLITEDPGSSQQFPVHVGPSLLQCHDGAALAAST